MKTAMLLPALVIIGFIILVIGVIFMQKGNTTETDQTETQLQEQLTNRSSVVTPTAGPDSLQIEDMQVGTGAEAKTGNRVQVHYTGTLQDGTKFDSSKDRNEPFEFTLGEGRVIAGWEQGVLGMKEGGKRKLTIRPELGYGAVPVGPIPANSTLLFEIELLKVQ